MSEVREFTKEQLDELILASVTQGGLIALHDIKSDVEKLRTQLGTDEIPAKALDLVIECSLRTFKMHYEECGCGTFTETMEKLISKIENPNNDESVAHTCKCHNGEHHCHCSNDSESHCETHKEHSEHCSCHTSESHSEDESVHSEHYCKCGKH